MLSKKLTVGLRCVVKDGGVLGYRGNLLDQYDCRIPGKTVLIYIGNGDKGYERFHVEGNESDIVELRPANIDLFLEESTQE